ncbi:MAG: hypothetical protein JXB09_03495 [Deltaproteobacteria bacterium]|nr:hypothetical protein [Deltaproteobacteria bacterium]
MDESHDGTDVLSSSASEEPYSHHTMQLRQMAILDNIAMIKAKSGGSMMLKVVMRLFIFAVFAMGLNCAWLDNVTAKPSKPTSLSSIVFFGIRPVTELEQGNNPGAVQTCVRKYLDAIPPNSSLWLTKVPSGSEDAVYLKRRNLVEQMVTILGENVRSEAQTFASAVPLLAEWEGMSEGPVAEADFADQWLTKRPETSIAPFLHLFKAHRLRAGYEAARTEHEKGLRPVLARRYRESIDKARSSTNPLISCITDDLEAQTYVYLQGRRRP